MKTMTRKESAKECSRLIQERLDAYRSEEDQSPEITILIVEPNKSPYVKTVCSSTESLESIIRGPLEGIPSFDNQVDIVCNEVGKDMGLPSNRALFDKNGWVCDVIAGTFLVVGTDVMSEEFYVSLPEDMIRKYSEIFCDQVCRWTYQL